MRGEPFEFIVTADDLGYSQLRDQGIVAGIENGVVSRASLLVNGLSAEYAANQAKDKNICTGLHVNLTEGFPVCQSIQEISTLVDPQTRMFLGVDALWKAFKSGSIQAMHVQHEICAQVERYRLLVQELPTYIDGHNHVHVLPLVAQELVRVMKNYGIRQVRIPSEQILLKSFESSLSETKLNFFKGIRENATRCRSLFQAHNILAASDAFIGISLMGRHMTEQNLMDCILSVPSNVGSCELMSHPGYPCSTGSSLSEGCGGGPDEFSRSQDRNHEVEFLVSQKAKDVLETPTRFSSSEHQTKCGIAIVSSLTLGTGNLITARRLSRVFQLAGHPTLLVNASQIIDDVYLSDFFERNHVKIVVGINAKRAGKWIVNLDPSKYDVVVVVGGTDVNDPSSSTVDLTQRAFARANAIVAFSPVLAKATEAMCPSVISKTHVIPQACVVHETGDFSIRKTLGLETRVALILLPCGLRPVKDPGYLFEAMQTWSNESHEKRVVLVLVGPQLDPSISHQVMEATKNSSVLFYLGSLPHGSMLSSIKEADIVVNTSLNEGMSNVLLESMALRTPVLARKNGGNCSIVEHGVNGFIFDSPEEFTRLAQTVLFDGALRTQLIERAANMMEERFSILAEQSSYTHLLEQLS
mmetsp:Transcript_6411/g.11002  ORF Transcript_6411/g.11002 Transcript_6411/m.11002 type:complete len:641 (-) Transcript_6411:3194-5116(-)|eukprot:CAMPEP_0203762240 /NCGR_PEP_ID=MMETSP0098-20131031/15169_1 /ASSEMBLY_ACC=CAM_ASM_000208 /TAXON_ID=96639 /ORGANISM=" , Strain NY0313808BC1" /LENGTH=640 /DNA_ID=CAMNT_0050656573 /DNA_START=80 /DNA_END=2002 /DNA_ORIENTATION=-